MRYGRNYGSAHALGVIPLSACMTPIEPVYPDIGRQIQLARERAGLTQTSLGLGLTPTLTRASIANIEAGKQRILVHTLIGIAATLQLPVEHLLPHEPSHEANHSKKNDSTLADELQRHLSQQSVGRLLKTLAKDPTHEPTVGAQPSRKTRNGPRKNKPSRST